ncbi:MAG TPA: extracellular solute-binding protein [Anaerolineales bacterium]|nr:extracellular solute-binding protein [Anaerolineales bacterium]
MQIIRKFLLLTFISTVILTACTTSETVEPTRTPRPSVTEDASAKNTATPVTSKLNVDEEALRGAQVTIWHPWFGAEASLFESQVAQFNTENEWGIVVSAESKSNYSELSLQTDAALAESANPNIVVALPEYAVAWRDHVVDLNAYVQDPIFGISSLEISDFPSVIWMQDEMDGVRLGMPAQRTARFILYNQTWARELGFDSTPKTFSDFERQACAAHAALGKDDDEDNDALGGWLIDDHAMTALSWMLAFDGGVQEEDGYRFMAPGNIEAFKWLKTLQQKGCAWVSTNEGFVYDRFASRRALFATASLEEFVDQSRAFGVLGNSDDWIILPFPGKETSAFTVYGSSFVMFQSDDVTQLAGWVFMQWILSAENQARWVQSTNLFPLRSSTMDLLGDYSASHPQWTQAVQLLPAGKTTPKLSSWRIVKIMMGDGFRDMFDTIRHPELTDGQVPLILKQMEETADELNK